MNTDGSFIFKGVATALITPFKNGSIDFESLGLLIERQIDNRISALVICGTTGEASTLSEKEHLNCIEFALRKADGRIPIIAGSGSNCTAKAVKLSSSASKLGCDALLVVTPYYNKASSEGLIKHYLSIAEAASSPIIIYNVPSRTGMDIPIDVYSKLADHKNIVGVKEAGGNLHKAMEIKQVCGDHLAIYSGNDDNIFEMLSIGASGVISVISNLMPSETVMICEKYFSNETSAAHEQQIILGDMIEALSCEINPIPIKFAMKLIGACNGEMRLPLCPPSIGSQKKITEAIKKYKLI